MTQRKLISPLAFIVILFYLPVMTKYVHEKEHVRNKNVAEILYDLLVCVMGPMAGEIQPDIRLQS